jgi:hypothetical protein
MQNVNLEQEVIDLSEEKWRWMSERTVEVSLALAHPAAYLIATPITTENQGEYFANCKIEQWR